jgi:hypothetical protein
MDIWMMENAGKKMSMLAPANQKRSGYRKAHEVLTRQWNYFLISHIKLGVIFFVIVKCSEFQ